MKKHFSFGQDGVDVNLPEKFLYKTVEGKSVLPIDDVAAALDRALDSPIGALPLEKLAEGKQTAAISVCDITRPAPNSITLPPLLRRLHAGGIPVSGITFLIATGLHRPATEDEIERILGREIATTYKVVNHDARVLSDHRYLGETRRGTPVHIDERFLQADLRISLGFIEQHLMLGFSGGRKLIVPGLAAQETIKVIHSPKFMREPMSKENSIEENPLHAEFLEIAGMARHDFILDVTLTKEREISGVFAGNPVKAHAAGVGFLRSNTLETLEGYAELAITSAAGYPLDLTFYQSVKGLSAAQHLVRPGGRILILSECAEGVGSPEFARSLEQMSGCKTFLDELLSSPVEVDQWQLERLALMGANYELYFYTPGVTGKQLGCFASRCFSRLEEAMAAAFEGLPAGSAVVLIPEGPYAFAQVQEFAHR